ncbi:unnamed protein product [Schistosoma margrebowiei]|uniref:Uncharacterized protein n=1 Tax=Schistosoma margrebowiei TaxID=48269 RepID=A0A183LZU4_9TREM|nr:unnamed protein product [Schistosoma margrebowiei]
MNKTSFTERYDKLGLLSNSYSFQWENNSFHTTNKDNKYKSFLLFLYNTTKYKIEKTFNTLQCYHKLIIQKSNYSLDKEIINKSIPIQLNEIDNINNNQQYNTYIKENIMKSNSYYISNDNSFKLMDSLYNSGCIIHRKHIKYRKWKNKINIKHKKTCINIKINEKSINFNNNNNILIFNNDSQQIDSKYSLKTVIKYNKISNIHKQYLFGQLINDNQWDLFLFLLNTDININSIQKKIKLSNEHETTMIEIYPSVIDLFLRNIPSNLSSTSSSSSSSTNGIYSIILSCLLEHEANIHNINQFYQYTYNGGIQLNTLSYIFEQIAIQLNYSLQIINIINHSQLIDNAGLLRQLLNSGMIPIKLFFLIYTNKLFIFNIKESIILNHNHHHNHNNNNTNQIYKNHFYPLLINELVKWYISNQNKTQYLPIILQSFIILFFNFIYSGLCKLPENVYDIIDNNLINQYNHNNNQYIDKDYMINNQYYLSYFIDYHNKFLKLINKQPFSLFVQCRYKIRNQIDIKYFNKLIMNSNIFNNNNNNQFIINNEFYKKLIQLPDSLKHAIGYMEGIHLKNELYTLTQIM